ncbi:hypothetical protein [Altererythrobacter sp. ZODW24]|uniref:hypothetical protein n=1 Tax=Altererythrobacter sp. ZODW24 TaxID=2185142 RepID=UPI000DF75A89|nr:hypothetical protein [Altererythrobacter sp. ZODW24]
MKRHLLMGGAALALCSTFVLAQDAPESLLPPKMQQQPAPKTATPVPTVAPAPAASSAPSTGSTPVVQPTTDGDSATSSPAPSSARVPSIQELERLSTDELDQLLGLKPRFDIPRGARRSLEQVGIIGADEGGLAASLLANQPGSLVRAALAGTKKPMVSRWGHIMLRRALASRLNAPDDMRPVEFAALRTAVLNSIGEHAAARALVQDVDTANYSEALTDAAIDAYIGTADIVGACPAVRLKPRDGEDPQWNMLSAICRSYAGEGSAGNRELDRALRGEIAPEIDILLAQRFAGAAGDGRRAVNIEWEGVDELNPWRYALARAVGLEVPDTLLEGSSGYYQLTAATSPMVSLPRRAEASDYAAAKGVLSSAALVDLYSQIFETAGIEGDSADVASLLRNAYVGEDDAARLVAIRSIWGGEGAPDYGRQVLTAYAAARLTPSEALAPDAFPLITSMLAAGLDNDAMRWANVLPQGSSGWALLSLAQPTRGTPVDAGAVSSFIGDDASEEQRKSQFLVAGLAGLGRLETTDLSDLAGDLSMDIARESKWSQAISGAADVNNPALVAMLAGVGMQGESWSQMTPRHLFHIVSALNRVGMSAEARMIAAEAVARG